MVTDLIEQKFELLDKGFIRVVNIMGDESSIVQSARVSYGKGTKSVSDDQKLLKYLAKHEHWSPFEMCEIAFHIKLPIFVARQWMRHRTGSFNEVSARYSEVVDDFYIPLTYELRKQHVTKKQCSGDKLPDVISLMSRDIISAHSRKAYAHYMELLGLGLSREQARMVLPVNTYTEFYWKVDLRNLLHFIKLRADEHAQFEIREYATCLKHLVREWTPTVYTAVFT